MVLNCIIIGCGNFGYDVCNFIENKLSGTKDDVINLTCVNFSKWSSEEEIQKNLDSLDLTIAISDASENFDDLKKIAEISKLNKALTLVAVRNGTKEQIEELSSVSDCVIILPQNADSKEEMLRFAELSTLYHEGFIGIDWMDIVQGLKNSGTAYIHKLNGKTIEDITKAVFASRCEWIEYEKANQVFLYIRLPITTENHLLVCQRIYDELKNRLGENIKFTLHGVFVRDTTDYDVAVVFANLRS